MKFFIKDFFSKCDQIFIFPADLVTCTEEILNGKLNFIVQYTFRLFKNRSRKTQVDPIDIKFVFFTKKWFLRFNISLSVTLL